MFLFLLINHSIGCHVKGRVEIISRAKSRSFTTLRITRPPNFVFVTYALIVNSIPTFIYWQLVVGLGHEKALNVLELVLSNEEVNWGCVLTLVATALTCHRATAARLKGTAWLRNCCFVMGHEVASGLD